MWELDKSLKRCLDLMSQFTIWITTIFFVLFLAMGLINKCHMLALLQSATVCVLLLCLLVLMYLIITCNDQMLTMQMNGIKSYDFLYKVIHVCSFIRLGDM